MIELKTPRGLPARVPETLSEDPSPRFSIGRSAEIKAYYEANGYVIVSGVLSAAKCDSARRLWDHQVKPSSSFIYRQATAKAETHVKNERGWVMNPILNLQSLDPREFGDFREFSTAQILTDANLIEVVSAVLGDDPVIVQSTYFEGNSATWEHQDTYYLDSERVGSMVGTWIALEDIQPQAGRFFVCAKSQRIDMGRHSVHNNIVDFHEEYISSVVKSVRKQGLKIRAPFLRKGDVLLWNSKTIHGSLDSHDPENSRSSITVHAIPASTRFLQLQNRIVPLRIRRVNGVAVHCPKDLARMRSRAVMALESRYPKAFYAAKRLAVRSLMKLKARNG